MTWKGESMDVYGRTLVNANKLESVRTALFPTIGHVFVLKAGGRKRHLPAPLFWEGLLPIPSSQGHALR